MQFEKSLNERLTVNQTYNHHQVVCLMTGPPPLPMQVIHRMRCGISFFYLHYLVVSLRLSIADYVFFLFFPSLQIYFVSSIPCMRMQFLRKTWRIQLAFFCFIVFRIFLSPLTLCNTSLFHKIGSTDLLQCSLTSDFKTFKVCLICFPKSTCFNTIQSCGPNVAFN